MSEHTPGPWEPRDTADYAEIVAADGTVVAMVGRQRDVGPVAAVPELLACCEAARIILKNRDQRPEEVKLLAAINATIAKAASKP